MAGRRRLSLGFFSRYPRARCLCPDPNREPARFVDWVGRIRFVAVPIR